MNEARSTQRRELRIEKEIVKKVRMDYQLYLPSGYGENTSKKVPMILYLHGAGGSGSEPDLVRREGLPAHIEATSNLPFLVVAPQCPIGVFWNTQEDEVMAILDEVAERWNVDSERVYLTGYSMGAYGVWHLAVHYPERFAAIAPVSGGGDPAYARKLREMPAWIFHGTDDEIIHASESEKIAEAMRKAGADVELTLYPGSGHDCWKKVYANEGLYRWFLEHTVSGTGESGNFGERKRTDDKAKREKAYASPPVSPSASDLPPSDIGDGDGEFYEAGTDCGFPAADLILRADGTDRLRIEPVADTDTGELLELELKNKALFGRFSVTRDESFYTPEGQERRVRGAVDAAAVDERYLFTVRLRATGELIGIVDLTDVARGSRQSARLDYFPDRDPGGRSCMAEAVRFMVRHAFEVLVLHRIEADVMPDNGSLLEALEKAGFRREGIARGNLKINGRWRDHVLLAALNPKDMAAEETDEKDGKEEIT